MGQLSRKSLWVSVAAAAVLLGSPKELRLQLFKTLDVLCAIPAVLLLEHLGDLLPPEIRNRSTAQLFQGSFIAEIDVGLRR
jgi:hypothetical protein